MASKLWLLKANDGSPYFDPWYDKAFGFVCRAEGEAEARFLASRHGGDENVIDYEQTDDRVTFSPWLHREHTSCEFLGDCVDSSPEVIIRDYHSA